MIAAAVPVRSRTRCGGLKMIAAPPTMSWPWNASEPPMSCTNGAPIELVKIANPTTNVNVLMQRSMIVGAALRAAPTAPLVVRLGRPRSAAPTIVRVTSIRRCDHDERDEDDRVHEDVETEIDEAVRGDADD